MTYTGEVKNGVVVFDGGSAPPNGTKVQIVVPQAGAAVSHQTGTDEASPEARDLRQTLLKFAGKAKGLPPDMARNHDHYLYGVSKREARL